MSHYQSCSLLRICKVVGLLTRQRPDARVNVSEPSGVASILLFPAILACIHSELLHFQDVSRISPYRCILQMIAILLFSPDTGELTNTRALSLRLGRTWAAQGGNYPETAKIPVLC